MYDGTDGVDEDDFVCRWRSGSSREWAWVIHSSDRSLGYIVFPINTHDIVWDLDDMVNVHFREVASRKNNCERRTGKKAPDSWN